MFRNQCHTLDWFGQLRRSLHSVTAPSALSPDDATTSTSNSQSRTITTNYRATMDAATVPPEHLNPAVSPPPLQRLLADPKLLPTPHPAHLVPLPCQIQHNLHYQHDWSALR